MDRDIETEGEQVGDIEGEMQAQSQESRRGSILSISCKEEEEQANPESEEGEEVEGANKSNDFE